MFCLCPPFALFILYSGAHLGEIQAIHTYQSSMNRHYFQYDTISHHWNHGSK